MTRFGHSLGGVTRAFQVGAVVACLVSLVLLVASAVVIAGCGERAATAAVVGVAGHVAEAPPAPVSTAEADAQIKQARTDRAELQRQLDGKDQEIGRLADERDALAQEDVRRRLAWLAGLLLLGIPASVALWFILPAGLKSWAIYGGLACIGFSAAAYALRALVPWLELIGWGLLAGGAAWGLWQLRRFKRAAIAAADHGERLEASIRGLRDWFSGDEAVLEAAIGDVKHDSAVAQQEGGTRRVLALIRGKDPQAPTAPALAGLAQPPTNPTAPPAGAGQGGGA